MNLQNRFKIDRSANHCHLTLDYANHLFGKTHMMDCKLKPLNIKGEFATNFKVEDGRGIKYTVLYPWRQYSQLELSASDYYKIFKVYPTRVNSGDLVDANLVVINDSLLIPTIVVKAHVHIAKPSDYDLLEYLKFPFELSLKYNESVDGYSHIHLDTDQYASIQGN